MPKSLRKNLMRITIAFALLAAALLIIYLFAAERGNRTVKGNPTDSLFNAFNELPQGKYESAVAREHSEAYYNGSKEYYDTITAYFEKRAAEDNNNVAWSYLKANKATFLLNENKPRAAIAMAKEAERHVTGTDVVGLGNIYNTLASSYYHLGRMDSAKYYMTKGYLFATSKNVDVFISTFAINLGTYYYDHMLYGAASHYFNIALESAKRQNNIPLMLINNITSILGEQHLYKESDSLWNIYLEKMQTVKDPYEHQLYFLNYNMHLQNMNRWKEAQKVYAKYTSEEIYDILRIPYLHIYLNQAFHDRAEGTASFFIKHRHWIGERYIPAVTEMFNELEEAINLDPSLLPMDTLLQWEKNFAAELKENPKASANSNKLKSMIAYKQGNLPLSYKLLEKSRLNDREYDLIYDSLRHADFAEKNELNKLREDIDIANLKVQQSKDEKRYHNKLWILSFLVLVCLIVLLLFALSYRKARLDRATEQINFLKVEEAHLLKEQELNTRIVNLSQLIVLKAQDLGKKIKQISSENKEALQEIKKEIDELSRLGIEDKPQLADKLIDDHQPIFDRFPEFAEMSNLTEKRIFILSVDGYKPKEIANVVGVSIQYVHNVRTRLRKKLKLDNSIEWESLKKASANKNEPQTQVPAYARPSESREV